MSKKQNEKAKQRQAELDRQIRAQVEEARRREAAAAALAQGARGRPATRPGAMVALPSVLQQQQVPRPRPRGPVAPPVRQVRVPVPPQRAPQAQQQQQQKKAKKRLAPPPMPVAARAVQPLVDTPGVLESEIGQGSPSASPTRRQAAMGPRIRLTP